MRKKGGLFVVILLSICLFTACGAKQEEAGIVLHRGETEIEYVTVQPSLMDIVQEERMSCTYKESMLSNLYFGLDDYPIAFINVKKGDWVEAGQLLAGLDLGEMEGELPELEYQLSAGQLELQQMKEKKEYELNAAYILYSYGKMEKKDKEALEKKQKQIERQYQDVLEELQDQVTVAAARLNAGKEEMEKGLIYAPVTGEVTFALAAEEGQYCNSTQRIAAISDLTNCYFSCSSMKYAQYFKEGISCQVKTEGAYTYNVLPYDMESWATNNEMKFVLMDENDMVTLGTNGTLILNLGEKKNVLCIPSSAVHTTEKDTFVYVLEDGIRQMRYIKAGLSGGDNIEVLEGLTEEDIVILEQEFSEEESDVEEGTGEQNEEE